MREKKSIQEALVVEGKYDKVKLMQLFDTLVIATHGFAVFQDKGKQQLIRKAAHQRGIILLTDSDRAGFVIRNFITGLVPASEVKQAYIPQIEGKERRKDKASKDGFLGVEGIEDSMIVEAVERAASSVPMAKKQWITKADFYLYGLSGRADSAKIREEMIKGLSLPKGLSANAFLQVLNSLYTYEEFVKIAERVNNAQSGKQNSREK